MFDKEDARLIAKVALLFAGASSLLIALAGVVGLALRIFGMAAG